MMSLPNSASSPLVPRTEAFPNANQQYKDPTPQAIPNMVRNERSFVRPQVAEDLPEDVQHGPHG